MEASIHTFFYSLQSDYDIGLRLTFIAYLYACSASIFLPVFKQTKDKYPQTSGSELFSMLASDKASSASDNSSS